MGKDAKKRGTVAGRKGRGKRSSYVLTALERETASLRPAPSDHLLTAQERLDLSAAPSRSTSLSEASSEPRLVLSSLALSPKEPRRRHSSLLLTPKEAKKLSKQREEEAKKADKALRKKGKGVGKKPKLVLSSHALSQGEREGSVRSARSSLLLSPKEAKKLRKQEGKEAGAAAKALRKVERRSAERPLVRGEAGRGCSAGGAGAAVPSSHLLTRREWAEAEWEGLCRCEDPFRCVHRQRLLNSCIPPPLPLATARLRYVPVPRLGPAP